MEPLIPLRHFSSQMDSVLGERRWRETPRRTMKMMPMKLILLFCSILTWTNAQWTAQTNETLSYSSSSSSSSLQPYVSYLVIASKIIRPNTLYKVRINRYGQRKHSNLTTSFKGYMISLARCDTARGQRGLPRLGIDLSRWRRPRHQRDRGAQMIHKMGQSVRR